MSLQCFACDLISSVKNLQANGFEFKKSQAQELANFLVVIDAKANCSDEVKCSIPDEENQHSLGVLYKRHQLTSFVGVTSSSKFTQFITKTLKPIKDNGKSVEGIICDACTKALNFLINLAENNVQQLQDLNAQIEDAIGDLCANYMSDYYSICEPVGIELFNEIHRLIMQMASFKICKLTVCKEGEGIK